MTVGTEGDLDSAVAEALHDRPRMSAFGDQHCCIGMAKVVESSLSRETSAGYGRLEVPSVEIGVSEALDSCHRRVLSLGDIGLPGHVIGESDRRALDVFGSRLPGDGSAGVSSESHQCQLNPGSTCL